MGLKDDLERYREVGEERREDLADFIKHHDLGPSDKDKARIPIKIVDLPGFEYDPRDKGGVGQGEGVQPGDPVGQPQPQPGDEEGEPGDEAGEHDYYEMDPEEFAEELDEELGLDLEPKGKQSMEEQEGDLTDTSRTGPKSMLDFERLFKRGLKRKIAMDFDEDYVTEALKVDGQEPGDVFYWAREQNIPVSRAWIENRYDEIPEDERGAWDSLETMEDNVEQDDIAARIRREGIDQVPYRPEDEKYRYPEIIREPEKNVVMFFVRDVSGSMREDKRDLVERVATPLNWYLTGKYDEADDRYVAHDTEAWEEDRANFFGIRSGGGTRVSEGVQLAADIAEEEYPWSEWNRYFFLFGDGENRSNDTKESVAPLMDETDKEYVDANLWSYFQVQPNGGSRNANLAGDLEDAIGDQDNLYVTQIEHEDDVIDAIYGALSTEGEDA